MLLVSLTAVLIIYPYLLDRPETEALLVLLNSAVVLTAIYAVSVTRRHFKIALLIGVPQLLLSWMNVYATDETLSIAQAIFTALFYGYALTRVLDYVVRGREVTLGKMYGAAGVYLLMGYMWASCYDLVAALQAGSFAMSTSENPVAFRDLVHFSFVTLTSLGYGDVVPVSDQARSLSFLEAIAGNLYLAVLVARLVGLYRPEIQDQAPGKLPISS